MPARLARKDLSQSSLLILICPFVHVEGDFLFYLQHVAGRISRKRSVEPIQIDIAKVPLVDVPGKQNGTVPACGRAQKDAWTHKVTITGFK
jgi:hypothetical protein